MEIGSRGLLKPGFGIEGIAKASFCKSRLGTDFDAGFWWCSGAWGSDFPIFVALRAALKMDEFSDRCQVPSRLKVETELPGISPFKRPQTAAPETNKTSTGSCT